MKRKIGKAESQTKGFVSIRLPWPLIARLEREAKVRRWSRTMVIQDALEKVYEAA